MIQLSTKYACYPMLVAYRVCIIVVLNRPEQPRTLLKHKHQSGKFVLILEWSAHADVCGWVRGPYEPIIPIKRKLDALALCSGRLSPTADPGLLELLGGRVIQNRTIVQIMT